jgi:hypothetical protein
VCFCYETGSTTALIKALRFLSFKYMLIRISIQSMP